MVSSLYIAGCGFVICFPRGLPLFGNNSFGDPTAGGTAQGVLLSLLSYLSLPLSAHFIVCHVLQSQRGSLEGGMARAATYSE